MIAHVVPAVRLRRHVTWWSYSVPARTPLVPGSLVVVSFRNRPTLGVVWAVDPQEKPADNTKPIEEVLVNGPWCTPELRGFMEYCSEYGLCSLPSALYFWLPAALRKFPLTKPVRESLRALRLASQAPAGQLYLLPGHRPRLDRFFAHNRIPQTWNLTDREEWQLWLDIASGKTAAAAGSVRALCLPWRTLAQCTVIEPEDIGHFHEQTPHFSLGEAAFHLGAAYRATLAKQTYLPQAAADALWPGDYQGPGSIPAPNEITDLRREPLLNNRLLERIKANIAANLPTTILYNAHTRTKISHEENGTTVERTIPGIESFRKNLQEALGLAELPASVRLGTRSMLSENIPAGGLAVALSLDPLLGSQNLADLLHGVADLGRLSRIGNETWAQTHEPEHPLVFAWTSGELDAYLASLLENHKQDGQPPFGRTIALVAPESGLEEADAAALAKTLSGQAADGWQVSDPFLQSRRKKPYRHIVLHHPNPQAFLPLPLRTAVLGLEKPWQALHNPWHLW